MNARRLAEPGRGDVGPARREIGPDREARRDRSGAVIHEAAPLVRRDRGDDVRGERPDAAPVGGVVERDVHRVRAREAPDSVDLDPARGERVEGLLREVVSGAGHDPDPIVPETRSQP